MVTVKFDEAMIPENFAVICAGPPAVRPVTTPALLTVASAGLDEVQVTRDVNSLDEPSEYSPNALNCDVFPTTMLVGFGVTSIFCNAGVTVNDAVPLIPENVAVIMIVTPD